MIVYGAEPVPVQRAMAFQYILEHKAICINKGELIVFWGLKELNFPSLYQMEEIPVMQVNRSRDNKPVHVDVDMEGLLEKVSAQNFVPVIDDEKVFIGIITRRDVIHYLAKQCRSREESAV